MDFDKEVKPNVVIVLISRQFCRLSNKKYIFYFQKAVEMLLDNEDKISVSVLECFMYLYFYSDETDPADCFFLFSFCSSYRSTGWWRN